MGIVALLLLLTLLSLLPFDPQGPSDASNYQQASGVELSFPTSGALIEPLLAPGIVLSGEPDVHIAAISTLIWIIIVAGGYSLYQQVRHDHHPKPVHLLNALLAAGAGVGIFISYLGFVLFGTTARLEVERNRSGFDCC